MSELLIGWTTCDNSDVAERLAHELIERDIAVCVQIDDSVRSIFKWEGQIQSDLECRLCVKFSAESLNTINNFIKVHHPYETPEWVVITPEYVSEKYLSWAIGG